MIISNSKPGEKNHSNTAQNKKDLWSVLTNVTLSHKIFVKIKQQAWGRIRDTIKKSVLKKKKECAKCQLLLLPSIELDTK